MRLRELAVDPLAYIRNNNPKPKLREQPCQTLVTAKTVGWSDAITIGNADDLAGSGQPESRKPEGHLLKEDLRLFWEQDSRGQAEGFISTWLKEARSVNNAHLSAMADTVESHLQGILYYYDHPIRTGPLDGINKGSRCSNE
jgi:hypothetical protein